MLIIPSRRFDELHEASATVDILFGNDESSPDEANISSEDTPTGAQLQDSTTLTEPPSNTEQPLEVQSQGEKQEHQQDTIGDPDEVVTGRLKPSNKALLGWNDSSDSDGDSVAFSGSDSSSDGDDSYLVPMANVAEEERNAAHQIAYLPDFIHMLQSDDYDKVESALAQLPARISEKSAQLGVVEVDLSRTILYLDNRFNMPEFTQRKKEILVALIVHTSSHHNPSCLSHHGGSVSLSSETSAVRYLHGEFHSHNSLLSVKLELLDSFVQAALELSKIEPSATVKEALRQADIHRVGTVKKRWGVRKGPKEVEGVNRFIAVAPAFFLPFLQNPSSAQAMLDRHPLVLSRLILALGVMLECAKNGEYT